MICFIFWDDLNIYFIVHEQNIFIPSFLSIFHHDDSFVCSSKLHNEWKDGRCSFQVKYLSTWKIFIIIIMENTIKKDFNRWGHWYLGSSISHSMHQPFPQLHELNLELFQYQRHFAYKIVVKSHALGKPYKFQNDN